MFSLTFSIVDYVVFGAMLVISFAIGIYHAFKSSHNNEEYVMGGHSIGIIPMAISLCASFNSAYMILGIPNEIYTYGTQMFVTIIGIGIGVLIAGEIWIPILYRLRVVSIYEYFELRYKSKFPRRLMTAIFVLKTILYLAIVLYAPTIALSSVTDLPWWLSILLLGICTTIYTAIGGIMAIVWTDVFQIFIIVGSLLALVIRGLMQTGGIANVWRIAEEGDRIQFFNWSLDIFERHTFLNVLFGSIILWGSPYTCSQYLVHRCLCLKSITKAKIALYMNYAGQIFLFTIVTLIGLILYAYYVECDPLLAGQVKKRDAIVAIFVLQEFVNFYGIPGLFISCLFSGALSTLDSAIHALATVTWEEIKTLPCFEGISDKRETTITKIISVAFGLLATGMAFVCSSLGSLISLGGKIFGATMGPMFAYILVSILLPPVNLKGSSIGLIVGQAINIWLSLGSAFTPQKYPELSFEISNCSTLFGDISGDVIATNFTTPKPQFGPQNDFEDIYRLSYNLYPIIGFILTATLSVVFSLATGGLREMEDADPRYFNPVMWRLFGNKDRRDEDETLDLDKSKSFNDHGKDDNFE